MKSAHVFLNFSYIIHSGSGMAIAWRGTAVRSNNSVQLGRQSFVCSFVRFSISSPHSTLLAGWQADCSTVIIANTRQSSSTSLLLWLLVDGIA